MKKSRPTAWSGPSRWLFCSLHPLAGPVPASQTPSSQDWLPAYSPQAPASDCPSKRRWGTHPSATLARNLMSLPDISSTYHLSPLEQRLLSPSHGSQHMVGSHSGTLFQTRQTPRPSNPWCLCCWLQAVSSGLKVGKYRPVGVQGAAQHPLSSSLPSPWNETKIAFWEMWVFLDNCVSTSIAEKLSSKLQPIWEYCFFAEQNYSA